MIYQMLRKISHFIFLLFAVMLLLTASSLAEEAGNGSGRVSNEDFPIGDGTNWIGELTNVDFDVDGDAYLPDDYLWYDPSTWGLTVEFTITAKGNFDVSVMNPTTEDPASFYEQDLIDTSFTFPFSTTLSSKLAARVGATVPIRMQGNFTDVFTYRLTWAFYGAIIPTESHDSDFKFTSLQPADPLPAGGTQFKAFFGSASSQEVGGFSIPYLLDPVLTGSLDYDCGVWADTTLAREEWDGSAGYLDNKDSSVHSCTEDGERGCLKGYSWSYNEGQINLWAQVHSPIFGDIVKKFKIDGTDWPTKTTEIGNFVQSLTWEDQEMKYQDFCDHIFYLVPVGAWLDHEKTLPAKDVYVYAADLDPAKVDPNVGAFIAGLTGSNPTIPEDQKRDGRVNLYLPWKDGKYTIAMDPNRSDPKYQGMSASAEQPMNMARGRNAQVNLFLKSREKIQYKAEKSWDIDLEYKDKPDSIEVLLQAQYDGSNDWTDVQTLTLSGDNGWSGTFDDVPRYEMDSEGNPREIPYRVRELEEQEEGSNKSPGDRVAEKSVSYTVPAYTTLAGEEIAEHRTKYKITYEETKSDDNHRTVWITNLAVLDFTVPKVWMGFDDEHQHPDSVFIALCYRVNHKYLDQVPDSPYKRAAETWIPVFAPLDGDMIGILSLLDMKWIEKVDPTGITKKLKIPLAIGIASDSNHWKLSFTTRKYGWTVVPGIPVEFKAMELTSALVTDLAKLITGYDIPLAPGIDINPGGDGTVYVSVPIAPIPVPGLNRDWDRYGTIINIYAGGKGAIGGAKYWVNDKDGDRPEKLYIHVKDPDNPDKEICDPIEIDKADFPDTSPWLWSLSGADVYEGVTLDSDKTYIISESFPEGYTSPYACEVDGHNLTNTKGKKLRLVVNIEYQPDPVPPPSGVTMEIRNKQGESIGPGAYTILYIQRTLELIDGQDDIHLNQEDLGSLVFTGSVSDMTPLREWVTKFDGPERSEDDSYITYTYTMLNRLQENAELDLQKKWNGESVSSVDVHLKRRAGDAAEEDLGIVTLTGDSWQKTVTSYLGFPLMRYASNGEEYTYIAEEEVPAGYRCRTTQSTEEQSDKVIWHFMITNTKNPSPLVNVKGTKTWDDDGDSGHLRPASLWIRLMIGDDPALDSHGNYIEQEISADTNWQFEFTGLYLRDDYGELIPYRITEFVRQDGKVVPLPDRYTPVYADPVLNQDQTAWTCDVTNSLYLVNIAVLKEWDDHNDVYRIRPDSVTVRLMKTVGSGTAEETDHAELNPDNDWYHVFLGLPLKTEGGETIAYSVTEDPVDSYTTTITGKSGTGGQPTVYHVTNALARRIQVLKKWKGDSEYPGVRPASVTVTLSRDGDATFSKSLVLKKENRWTGEFTDIPDKDPSGTPYVYRLTENPPDYYIASVTPETISGDDPYNAGFMVTNIYNNKNMKIPVAKIWADGGESHDPVTVTLYRNGVELDHLNLTAEHDWQGAFTDLERHDHSGVPYSYTITEAGVPSDYESSVNPDSISGDDTSGAGFTVTNTLLGDITVEKEWIGDENCLTETRPESVMVRLFADGEEADSRELTADGNWKTVFANRPLYRIKDDGTVVRIDYSVREEPVPGYQGDAPYRDPAGSNHFIIPNTLIRTDIGVQKIWPLVPPKELPESITVVLLSDWAEEGVMAEVARHTLSASSTMDEPWRCTFTNQPVWKKDRKIEYSVMEDPVPADYPNPQISQIGGYEFVIRNRHENKSDVLVFKFWEDGEDASGTRPDKVTFTLYCNGRSTGKTLELTPDTGWAGGFYNLERRSGELLNDYSVQETPVSGYTTVIEETETLEQRESGIFIFRATNSNEDIVMKIPVLKIWADGGESHDPVTVTLYRNGSSTGKTLELTPDTGWAGTFTDLERYDESGVPYSYTITEDGVPTGYESSVNPASISGDDTSGTGFTVTNAQLGDITVEKEWIGDDDCRADTRPTSVKVRLIADREEVKSAELTADGNWETVFEDCPLYRIKSDGSVVRINYSVREEPVPGYQGGIPYRDPADRNRFIILNTLIRTDVGVKKIWPLVPHEELPEEITVILLSDWAEEGVMAEVARHTLTPSSSENDHWAYTFRDQPVWKKNRKIQYSVEENPVPSGYRNPRTSKTDEYHFVIRNRHENQADVLVSKSWEDEEDVFGTRPDKVTFTLYCNGKSTGKTLELTPDMGWAGEFLELERKTGELLNVYSVRETSVDGYTTVIEETETPAEREEGIFIFQATNTLKTCTITYDPNGGTIDGSKDPVSEEHLYGEEITIRNEPVRDGYYFTYWKGSKYHPGDSYTVTGDHTFVAQWMRDDPRIFSFTFTKKWVGKTEDSLSWTLYYPDGRVRHKGFKKKVVSDTEWQYTAWFDSLEDYYLIEDVPPNYKVRYSNIGIHADETDRLYNGGTVYNYYIPKTSDNSGVLLYLGAVLLGCGLLGGVVLVRKRKRSGR